MIENQTLEIPLPTTRKCVKCTCNVLLRGEIVLSTHFVNPLKEGANDSKAAGEETCYYNNGILLLSLLSATVQSIGFWML